MGERQFASNKYLHALCAGLIVACMFLVFLFVNNIVPFGDSSWLVYDMNRQYLDFYSYFKSLISGENDIFYSFDISLGSGAIGFFTYYLSSPWLVLTLLFDKTQMLSAITLMIGCKLVLAGISCDLFMSHVKGTSNNNDDIGVSGLICSVGYVFSSFIISNSINPMWIDVFYIMPFFMWMTDRLLFQKKRNGYMFCLAMMTLANYYIAFMVCIFTLMWVIFRLVFAPCYYAGEQPYTINVKNTIKNILRVGICSVWAICMDCVLLIPTVLELANSPKDITELGLMLHNKNLGINLLMSKSFFGAYDLYQTIWGTPLVYCGILILILTILYFANSSISIRERIGMAIMIGIFCLSFAIDAINLLWHAGMEPSGYPYREAFMYVFICLYCSFRCLGNMREGMGYKRIILAFAAVIVAFVAVVFKRNEYIYVNKRTVVINIVFILCAVILILAVKRFEDRNNLYIMALVLMLCMQVMDLSGNSIIVYKNQTVNAGKASDYRNTTSGASIAVDTIKSLDSSFYRMESLSPREQNDPMMFDYKGITHYSSAGTLYTRDFLMSMGYNDDGLYANYGRNNTCTADTILGIKYLFGTEDAKNIHSSYSNLESEGTYFVKENENALSVAMLASKVSNMKADFVAGRKTKTFKGIEDIDPFEYQQTLLEDMTGVEADVFKPVTILKDENITNSDGNAEKDLVFQTESAGEVFFYLDDIKKYIQNLIIYKDDEFLTIYGNLGCHSILNLGYYEAGDTISIRVVADCADAHFGRVLCVTEDCDRLAEIAGNAVNRKIEIVEKSSSNISLVLPKDYKDTGSSEILMTVPYDSGWKVTSNGKELKTELCYGSIMKIDISKIESNEIEMKFIPEGYVIGLIITLLALLMVAVMTFIDSRSLNIQHRDSKTE